MNQDDTATTAKTTWQSIALVILSIRFVQGWIFWGGGSRRFFYDPQKLDPFSTDWMANKLQSAMPGALLGLGDIISFLLQHFILLYVAIIAFSLVELFSGLGLLFGFCTRLCASITAVISIILMLLFGWQGSTCVDEWTMAVSNFSMALTLILSGGSIYSIDHWLLHRHPSLSRRWWFISFASGPWSFPTLKRISIIFLLFTMFFTLLTYDYFRGSILTPYHKGPVSATTHHITLSDGAITRNGEISFVAYVDGGSPAEASHIIRIELVMANGSLVEIWDAEALSKLQSSSIHNDYAYNRFSMDQYGIVAPVSAKAKIALFPSKTGLNLEPGNYQIQIYTIEGKKWILSATLGA